MSKHPRHNTEVKINKRAKEALPKYLGCFGPRPCWAEVLHESSVKFAEPEDQLNAEFRPRALPPQFANPHQPKGATILVGPVIGMTTNRSTRIMIATNQPCNVKMECHGTDELRRNHHHVAEEAYIPTVNPYVFKVNGLKPNYRYSVTFSIPVYNLVNSEFRTMPTSLMERGFRFAIVSGNAVYSLKQSTKYKNEQDGSQIPLKSRSARHPVIVDHKTHATEASLWKNLYEKVCRREIDYVFHVGNNVTLGGFEDPDYSIFAAMAKNDDENMTNAYLRNVYISYWNEPWTKHVLANVPNIMVADEQDIGDAEELIDILQIPIADNSVAERNLLYYQMYQRSTWKDFDDDADPEHTSHGVFKLSPDIGIAMLDWRTHLVGNMPDDETLDHDESGRAFYSLGLQQKEAFENGLKQSLRYEPAAKKLFQSLIVLSPVNLTNPDSFIRKTGYGVEADFVLEEIAKWKKSGPFREAVVVSGIDHYDPQPGSRIADINGTRILQAISGPISNCLDKRNNYATIELSQAVSKTPEVKLKHTYITKPPIDLGMIKTGILKLFDHAYISNFKPNLIEESDELSTENKSMWRLLTCIT